MKNNGIFAFLLSILILVSCRSNSGFMPSITEIAIPLEGSFQNPAWSPDGAQIVFTRFRNGYNLGPADIYLYDLDRQVVAELVTNNADNVNLPGAVWNSSTNQIVFSSTQGQHDEIFVVKPDNPIETLMQITQRENEMAYEPSFSPTGEWIVFESHPLDTSTSGIIYKYKLDGSDTYIPLTDPAKDCRQPNWSPDGKHIIYQSYENLQWDIWIMNADGTDQRQITSGPGDKTDASFSNDSEWIVFSGDNPEIKFSELFIQKINATESIQITDLEMYAGAPSWSPDGKKIAFEAAPKNPDSSKGTTLWIMDYQ